MKSRVHEVNPYSSLRDARNFICDFILGKTQQLAQQKLF